MERGKLVEIKRAIERDGRVCACDTCTAAGQITALEEATQTIAAALSLAEAAFARREAEIANEEREAYARALEAIAEDVQDHGQAESAKRTFFMTASSGSLGGATAVLVNAFIEWNRSVAYRLDRLLFSPSWCLRAGPEFVGRIVPALLRPGLNLWDVGCGSRPFVDPETKARLGLTITGTDIDQGELEKMPAGSCDQVIVADLCEFRGDGCGDLVICNTVLEHVENLDGAFAGLVSMLRPGGTLALRAPCRNAWFARINLALPERVKRRLLFAFYQPDDGHIGFPARYDRCTPAHFKMLAERHGLEIIEIRIYWCSPYFHAFLPLWALWRLWQLCARPVAGDHVCEGFVMVAKLLPATGHGAGHGT